MVSHNEDLSKRADKVLRLTKDQNQTNLIKLYEKINLVLTGNVELIEPDKHNLLLGHWCNNIIKKILIFLLKNIIGLIFLK